MGFHYITVITKAQTRTLLRSGVIQMEFFDETLCEVEQDEVRYLLRRNPRRAEELEAARQDKHSRIALAVEEENAYLQAHPRANTDKARQWVQNRIAKLRVEAWLAADVRERTITLRREEESYEKTTRLDGCYVIKTDLPAAVADAQHVHDRYKDLAAVERAFRTCKTTHLEVRPVYVRTEASTRGHVLVVTLTYLIVRALRRAWAAFDLTVEEGLQQLATICSLEVRVPGQAACQKLPTPREESQQLLAALDIPLPEVLPCRNIRVVTRKKLPDQRKAY